MVRFSDIKILSRIKWIAEHAFFVFLFLFFISLILGIIMFYRYGILVQQTEPEPEVIPVQFRDDLYQDILKEGQLRQEKFEAADQKEYSDPFWINID
jgi:hypothetical protein